MSAAVALNAEARRVLAASITKLYASRSQRGGLRLHRSLLLSLVMRSARDIYHSSRGGASPPPGEEQEEQQEEEPMEEEEEQRPEIPEPQPESQPGLSSSEPAPSPPEAPPEDPDSGDEGGEDKEDKENRSPGRRSRKRRGKEAAAPDFLPRKRARLEPGEERHGGGAPLGGCRPGPGDSLTALSRANRVIAAF